MRGKINIITLGKSGAGKSSLLNYIIGNKHFDTGVGEPVTKDYFQKVNYDVSNVTYCLYDTKGIEPNTANEYRSLIKEKIKECDASLNFFDKIHSVYYCISASSKRIESYEINFIKELQKFISVIIVVTRKDTVTNEQLDSFTNQLYKEFSIEIQVIPVCSVAERTRKGLSKQEGRENILAVSFYSLWLKLSKDLPFDFYRLLHKNRFQYKTDISTTTKKILSAKDFPYSLKFCLIPNVELLYILLRNYYKENCNRLEIDNDDCIEIITSQLTIHSLKILPNLNDLDVNDLDQSDLPLILKLLTYIEALMTDIASDFKRNINTIWENHFFIKKQVIELYCNTTNSTFNISIQNKTEKLIEELIKIIIDYTTHIKKAINEVRKEIDEVKNRNSFFEYILNEDNRDRTRESWRTFINLCNTKTLELIDHNNYLISIYETELNQYGQCCLRSDYVNINTKQNFKQFS